MTNDYTMRTFIAICLIGFCPLLSLAGNGNDTTTAPSNSLPVLGTENIQSSFFRERYLHNNFVHYLDNLDDFNTYQSETAGDYQLPDLTIFSVMGNSYRWNNYYIDGFRIDNRLFPGSLFYNPDLYRSSLSINYYDSKINFISDQQQLNSIALRYNIGGLGGISPGTDWLVNLYHKTAIEREYKPFIYRTRMKGSGSLYANFSIPIAGKSYSQQFYADFGTRILVGLDETGISNTYPEDFIKAQLSGELPFTFGKLFDRTNYLCSYSNRQNLFNEFNYSQNESAQNSAFNFSFYGSKEKGTTRYTSGLTLATNKIRHNDLNFYRNVIDQDGEAFEPWYPDANTLELSHALTIKKELLQGVNLTFDGYNSVIDFNPTQYSFHNQLYASNVNEKNVVLPFHSLYIYEWESTPFVSGLLDNTLGLTVEKKLTPKLTFRGNVDLTLDGMLISSKSMLRGNWQGLFGLQLVPNDWFSIDLNIGRKRIPFNFDHIRYFSSDYLNGDQYYWKDLNSDQKYQEEEKSDYFGSTGGKYHSYAGNLRQQSYFIFDLPFSFHFGRHELSFINTYKKYNNLWTTRFDKAAEQYGYYQTVGDQQIFFLNPGEKDYKIDYYPKEYMTSDKFYDLATNSPYLLSSVIKYQYNGEKLLFSISWCSYIMCGISTLGNGPLHNNVDVFSESSANPNINYKLVGRIDQDRALIARILLSYKINKHLNFAFSGKFKDGQPLSSFNTKIATDEKGNNQMSMWCYRAKGIDPFTGEFGSREDACFNVELRTSYTGRIKDHTFDVQLMMYNLYDFGTELEEYNFVPDGTHDRYAMEINIPRGFMITTKFYL